MGHPRQESYPHILPGPGPQARRGSPEGARSPAGAVWGAQPQQGDPCGEFGTRHATRLKVGGGLALWGAWGAQP